MKTVLAVSRETMLRAEAEICGCETCTEDAAVLFVLVLDEVTGRDASVTDYVLSEPATCPACGAKVFEDTLVEPVRMKAPDGPYASFLT